MGCRATGTESLEQPNTKPAFPADGFQARISGSVAQRQPQFCLAIERRLVAVRQLKLCYIAIGRQLKPHLRSSPTHELREIFAAVGLWDNQFSGGGGGAHRLTKVGGRQWVGAREVF